MDGGISKSVNRANRPGSWDENKAKCFYAFPKSRIPRVSWKAEWECSGLERARSAGDLPRPTSPRRGDARKGDLVVWMILKARFLVRDTLCFSSTGPCVRQDALKAGRGRRAREMKESKGPDRLRLSISWSRSELDFITS